MKITKTKYITLGSQPMYSLFVQFAFLGSQGTSPSPLLFFLWTYLVQEEEKQIFNIKYERQNSLTLPEKYMVGYWPKFCEKTRTCIIQQSWPKKLSPWETYQFMAIEFYFTRQRTGQSIPSGQGGPIFKVEPFFSNLVCLQWKEVYSKRM